VDGNKRTAYVACRTFIVLNGTDLEGSADEKYLTFLKLAEGGLTVEELATWLRQHISPIARSRVQEPRRQYKLPAKASRKK
jgi:death-on-curing protein